MALSGVTVVIGCSVPQGLNIGTNWGGASLASGNNLPGDSVILAGAPVIPSQGAGVQFATGAFGQTTIPIEYWNAWFGANENSPLVVNGAVWRIS